MPNPFFDCQKGPLTNKTRSDVVKVTKNELRFGPLKIQRANTVPSMDFGRVGDIVYIDDTDTPSPTPQIEQSPNAVGMWIKVPDTYSGVLSGTNVIGFPGGTGTIGDIIQINGTNVLITAADAATIANAIVIAAIPNVTANVVAEALQITNTIGGAITITDITGTSSETLGIYSEVNATTLGADGVWTPFQFGISSSTGAPVNSSYLTLTNDVTLTDERVFAAGPGISVVDNGAGLTFVVSHDITSVTSIAEPVDGTDELLIYNVSTGNVEKITINDLPGIGDSVTSREVTIGVATPVNIGLPVPAGAQIKKVTLVIDTAYSIGANIEIGDAGVTDQLMTITENNAQELNTFETTTIFTYGVATQLLVTIIGAPVVGAGRVMVEFVT